VQSDGFWFGLDGGLVSRSLVYMLEDSPRLE
jgi:hypothetical protein